MAHGLHSHQRTTRRALGLVTTALVVVALMSPETSGASHRTATTSAASCRNLPAAAAALLCPSGSEAESESTELLAANAALAERFGSAAAVRPAAFAAASRQRQAIAAAGRRIPGTGRRWHQYGHGPLIGDNERFTRVAHSGYTDLAGRINHFAYDKKHLRLYASAGQGGVWVLRNDTHRWKSIGNKLPTQAVGGLAYSRAHHGTLLVTTGNDVFGGGTTFAGRGAYWSRNGGRRWHRSKGIPNGVNSFQVAVDPARPKVVYAATGAGLFRSTNDGKRYRNVKLPVSPKGAQPNCTGARPTVEGCFLANIVTDVVVRAPHGVGAHKKGHAVIAAVGWRAGDKKNTSAKYKSYEESPGNGLYTSKHGKVGTFKQIDPTTSNFADGDQSSIGRVELGAATGPKQDHDYLYAIVQNAKAFQGNSDVFGLDVPAPAGPSAHTTYLKGIYSSADFGKTWTLMATPSQLAQPGSGTALTGLACEGPSTYCPGVQSWYNAWIQPDPTRADSSGVPTRLVFGLEEVWQNRLADSNAPATGPTDFKVIGSYVGGTGCLFLVLDFPVCPTESGHGNTTPHADHHAGIFVPDPQHNGGVTLYDGNDGGVSMQHAAAGQPLSNADWGRGLNKGFNTLMPYDAAMARDGILYAGLQDNGELRSEPATGKQFNTHDGDGTWTAVDPHDSDIVYERQPGSALTKSSDGGQTWSSATDPGDTYQFVNPFVMDQIDSQHLLDAGNKVWETTDGAGTWTQVFDLGSSPAGVAYAMSAISIHGVPSKKLLPTGPHTDNFSYTDGAGTVPAGTTGTVDVPGTYVDHPFTIGSDDGDANVRINVSWASSTEDWDLYIYRQDPDGMHLIASSATFNPQTGEAAEAVKIPNPAPGHYVIRVVNSTAAGTFDATVRFAQRTGRIHAEKNAAAYVGFCGYCDALNTRPFDNGIATNVGGSKPRKILSSDGWHRAKAKGLPKRFITSITSDPKRPKTVYVTLAGYSRRWLPVGVLGEKPHAGTGNVFKSTDAGAHFRNITDNLPPGPAESVLVRGGKLIVGTDSGVYIARKRAKHPRFQLLGRHLPSVPVFTMSLKPGNSRVLYIATHGRGVYTYRFPAARKR